MKRLVTVLYSVAAGLEQACLTYETIKQANKAAALMVSQNAPEVKSAIGFMVREPQENLVQTFTAENP